MTRQEALLKLLALAPMAQDQLPAVTGWGEGDTFAVLKDLIASGQIVAVAHRSVAPGHRLCCIPSLHGPIIDQLAAQQARAADKRARERQRRGAAGRAVANANRRKASTPGATLV